MIDISPPNGAAPLRLLLAGDASARPAGLERALVRAGLSVVESESETGPAPALILLTALQADDRLTQSLAEVRAVYGPGVPVVVTVGSGEPDAVARALAAGAADAMVAPVNLVELVARLRARTVAPRSTEGSVTQPAVVGDSLDERVRDEFERARRYALSFSVVLLDVADSTDALRADMADLMRSELRTPDFVGRHGGEEFAVVLPETSAAGARLAVARLRDRFGAGSFAGLSSDPARLRLSAGIVTFPHPAAEEPGDVLALAEATLLRAKHLSGERIATAESVTVEAENS